MHDNPPHEYPIDGTLDLHQFAPRDTKEVVEEYIRACLEQKIYSLRIVHGKGKGVKREIVQTVLRNHPNVVSFRHEGGSGGSWGATVVDLKP
jgi:DNA-nicking Smr family endonuclease